MMFTCQGTLDGIQKTSTKEKCPVWKFIRPKTEPKLPSGYSITNVIPECSVNISDKIHMSYWITQDVGLTLWYYNRTHVPRHDQTNVSRIPNRCHGQGWCANIFLLSTYRYIFYLAQREENQDYFWIFAELRHLRLV